MSDEEVTVETSDGQLLTAEYKDGQLQIVEVTPYDKDRESGLLPLSDDSEPRKYVQVLDSGKGLVQLDLLNLTLVRGPDGEETFQFVTNDSTDELQSQPVTCVLQSSDTEDPESQESYVVMEDGSSQGSLVILKSSLQTADVTQMAAQEESNTQVSLTPAELLEKAKTLQRGRKAISVTQRRNRKRKSDLPPHHELLASPNFKLYLYSCKMCNYKCNAIKDMAAHKASEHGGGSRARNGRSSSVTLQCARCPFRGAVHSQLMKHVQEKHLGVQTTRGSSGANTVHLNTEEVEAADVLVCGACGFESSSRNVFKKHIEDEHGATTC